MFLMLLLAANPSTPLREYLSAAPGSPEEAAAIEKLRIIHAEDPASVESAIRNPGFIRQAPGLRPVRVPLEGVRTGEGPVDAAQVWLCVPKGYDPVSKWPVLILSHGTGGTGEGLAQSLVEFADEHGLILLAPQEDAGPADGWGSTDYQHALHLQPLYWLKRNLNVDDNRVFIHGVSRGAHAAWELAFSYPDLFAGAIPVVGALPNRSFRYLPSLLHVGVLDMQGAKDHPNLVGNVRDAVKLLEGLAYDITYLEDPEQGHYYSIDWDRVWNWMAERRRPAHPANVVVAATRDDRARAFWVRIEGLDRRKLENPPPARYSANRGKPSEAEMVRIVRRHYDRFRGLVRGEIKGNVIDLKVSRAPRVVVYLDDTLVDIEKKVTVRVNGRVRAKEVVPRSLETLLLRLKRTGERTLLYHATLDVKGSVR